MSFFKKARDLYIKNSNFTVIGRDQINVDQSVHTHTHHHRATATQEGNKLDNATTFNEVPKVLDVPNPSTLFQGRRAELKKLKEYFKPRVAGEQRSQRSLLFHGMGGIGKTQICLKFTEEAADQFGRIFWIDASTPETISLGVGDISEANSADSKGSVKTILQWISRLDEEWLLVFDNAEEHIRDFLPPGNRGNILMTSRNRSVGRSTSFKAIEVEQMDEDDAVSLLLKASCLGQDSPTDALRSTARAIVKELYCLPLAVDQAGASIESGLCNIDNYLQLYSSCRKDLLDDPSFRKATSYEQTVYGTWELSYREIEAISVSQDSPGLKFSPEAAQTAIAILQIFAGLHHDNIKQDIFKQAAANLYDRIYTGSATIIINHKVLYQNSNGEWDELHFQTGVRVLLSFSLIKQSLSTYTVHPLVHAWSQDRIPSDQQIKYKKEAKSLLSLSISWCYEREDYLFRQHLVPHVKANSQFISPAEIEKMYDDDDCMAFGLVLDESGDRKKAKELYTLAWNIRKDMFGPEHPDTLRSMASLACTYSNQGRWKEAEELAVQVLEMRKTLLGPEHPDTLLSMANLASTYWNQGRWKEAEELAVQVLEMRKTLLGPEHPDTLHSMASLASIYQEQESMKEAEELLSAAIHLSRLILG